MWPYPKRVSGRRPGVGECRVQIASLCERTFFRGDGVSGGVPLGDFQAALSLKRWPPRTMARRLTTRSRWRKRPPDLLDVALLEDRTGINSQVGLRHDAAIEKTR